MPRKKKRPRKDKAAAIGIGPKAPPDTGRKFIQKAKAARGDEAVLWRKDQILIKAMHRTITLGNAKVYGFERHLVAGMEALVRQDFDEAFRRLEMMVREILDPYVFAFIDFDEVRGVYRRTYSSRPDEFPVTDYKPLPDSIWTEHLKGHNTLADNNLTALVDHIPDAPEGLAMGCQCFCYMPVVGLTEGDGIVGVLALLAKKDYFHMENVSVLAEQRTGFWIFLNALRLVRTYGSSGKD